MADPIPAELPPALVEALTSYWATRDAHRAHAVQRRWGALSPREQRLLAEAAVMGYVQGAMAQPGGHKATIPPNSTIVSMVIDACLSFPDLYPTINRAGSRRRG